MTEAVDIIAQLLTGKRFDLSSEIACQDGIEGVLLALEAPTRFVSREHRLGPRDRPDFLVDGVVVEVKAHGCARRPVLRQLTRYAQHAEVLALVLVTATALDLPAEIEGKPLRVVSLGRSWL